MTLLAGVNYDPSSAVSKATSSLLAMTALDTTNLRLTFTPGASGNVLVRLRSCLASASTSASILLGVLSSSTVIGRVAPIGGCSLGVTTAFYPVDAVFCVTGLSGSQTWDAAYGVQVVVASSNIKYGGPNDTTANNAWGGFAFEVWDAPNLLGACLYDPTTAGTVALSSLKAMTAIDTTNLRITFTAPTSGNVLVRIRCAVNVGGVTTNPQILLGVLEGSTVRGRTAPMGGRMQVGGMLTTTTLVYESSFIVKGLSAGSHSYDAAYGVETTQATGLISYGGPNDNAGADAWGAFAFEVWAV